MICKGKGSDKMNKNKKIGLVVLLVIGILICAWSIYNSVITMSQNNSSATDLADSNSSKSNKDGSPTIIDDENADEDSSDSTNEDSSEEDVFNNNQEESSDKYIIYTVEKDETLKDICKKYSDNCPVPVLSKAILKVNNLNSSSKISEGKKIKIPEKYINTGIKYTVSQGDSLSSIAVRFMKDHDYSEALEIIKRDNFLSSDTIKIGDELYIRADDIVEVNNQLDEDEEDDADKDKDKSNKDDDKEKNEDKETISQNQEKSGSNTSLNSITNRIGNLVTYTVKKNDTLKSIAKNYDKTCPVQVASKIILEINGLDSSSAIKEDMKIKLPESYLSEGSIYTVKTGDTLSNIVIENMPGIDYNLALKIIVEDNDIKNYTIYPNQELFIASID